MKTDTASYFFYILLGYLSGSVLYSYLLPKYLCHVDVRRESEDGNPGAFNAFACGGAAVGCLACFLDLAKGFLPVYLAGRSLSLEHPLFAAVILAPVVGHAWPFLQLHRGGKAISVSFGVLLGLSPDLRPALLLAVCYLVFSLVLIIRSHSLRSEAAFSCFGILSQFLRLFQPVKTACLGIAALVFWRHYRSQKELQEAGLPFTFSTLSAKLKERMQLLSDTKLQTNKREDQKNDF